MANYILDWCRWLAHEQHKFWYVTFHFTLPYLRYFFLLFLRLGIRYHRLFSNSLCSWVWLWTSYPPISTFPNTGTVDMYHHAQFIRTGNGTNPWPHTCSVAIHPRFIPKSNSKNWSSKIHGDSQAYRLICWVAHVCLSELKQKPTVPVIVLSPCALWLFTVTRMHASLCSISELGWGAKVWMRWCL